MAMKAQKTKSQSRAAQPPLPSALTAESRPLPAQEQSEWSAKFGHDFSRVNILDGPNAHGVTQSLGVRGMALPQTVMLGPEQDRGRDTLAHELAHVAQMEKDGPEVGRGSAEREARNTAAGGTGELHAAASGAYMDDPQKPILPSSSGYQLPADLWDHKYDLKVPPPLFTPGAGPATPRAGTGGDVLSAVMGIPAVGAAASGMGDHAVGDLKSAWTGSPWWGKLFMGGAGLSMASLLALPLAMPQSRDAAAGAPPYSFLQNTPLPLGPASAQFNLAGPDKNFKLMLDLAKIWSVLK